MQRSSTTSSEAELDAAFRHAKRGGGPWIVAAVVAFVGGAVSGVPAYGAVGFATGVLLFAVGMVVRRRRWRELRRAAGDDAVQRAIWRYADAEQDRSAGPQGALGLLLVAVLLLVLARR